MQIQVRMNIILLSVLLVLGVMTIVLSYMIETRRARGDIEHDADLLIALASATRLYTFEEIRPIVRDGGQEPFHPQIVPAYAAQKVFFHIRGEFPGFRYREAMLNPTNRLDLAGGLETAIVQQFRETPSITVLKGETEDEGEQKYFLAKPIRIKDEACLACHSTPEVAPANMLAIYGKWNGFGWKLGETVGVQIITFPVARAYNQARASVITYAVSTIAIIAIVAIVVNLLLHRSVFSPLRRITAAAERFAAGDISDPDLKGERPDEIGALERAVEKMWRSFNALVRNRGDKDDKEIQH